MTGMKPPEAPVGGAGAASRRAGDASAARKGTESTAPIRAESPAANMPRRPRRVVVPSMGPFMLRHGDSVATQEPTPTRVAAMLVRGYIDLFERRGVMEKIRPKMSPE